MSRSGHPSLISACRALAVGAKYVGDNVSNSPVHLLWKWPPLVARSKAGFDVPERAPVIERLHRRHEHRGGVPLREHPVRLHYAEDVVKATEQVGGQLRQALIRLHQVQLVMRLNSKQLQHLIEHLSMLSHRTDHRPNVFGVTFELLDDRRHLDSLRPGAEHTENGHHGLRNAGARLEHDQALPTDGARSVDGRWLTAC